MLSFLPPLIQQLLLALALLLLVALVVRRLRSGETELLDPEEARKFLRRAWIGGVLLCLPITGLVLANLSTIKPVGFVLPVAAFYVGWASYWGLHRWFLFLGQGLAESEGLMKFAYFFLLVALGPLFGVAYGVPGGGLYEWLNCRRALTAPTVGG